MRVMSSTQEHISNEISFEKLKELDAYFDQQLKGQKKRGAEKKSGYRFSLKKGLGVVAGSVILLALPFLVLIRCSLYLYEAYSLNGWLALSAGVGVTILLLLLYASVVNYRVNRSPGLHKYTRRGIVFLVIAYCGYGLLYFSGLNAKNADVESYYRSLHPILRVTMATTILLDEDLIVTDMQRTPEDYIAMGLPVRDGSLYYEQETGYVHAVDIRTIGRPEWKNWLTKNTFALLGLKTLRHTGTADHLHVSLPLND